MKTYRIPRPFGFMYLVGGALFIGYFLQLYKVGMLFITEEPASYIAAVIFLGGAIGYFYGAILFYRYQITIKETGITISYPFKRPKTINWLQFENIKSKRWLFFRPRIVLYYQENNKSQTLKLIKAIEPQHELVYDLYTASGIPIPGKKERYINRMRKGYRRWKEMVFAVIYLIFGLAGVLVYKQMIPYGSGFTINLLLILFWMLGWFILWIYLAWLLQYSSKKVWMITILLSIFGLSALGIYQSIIDAKEIWTLAMISVMNAILFSMVIISPLKDNKMTKRIGSGCAIVFFLLFYFSSAILVPQVKPKKIAELAGPYAWGGSVSWSGDGKEVIVDTAMERYKPIWDIISIDSTHMVQKPQSDKEGNPRYIYDPIWAPDGTRFLADAFYTSDTAEVQSLILGDLKEKPFQFLDTRVFKRTKKDLAYTGMLNRLMAQPWSPDSKSAVVWRAEYISDTTTPIYNLYYYLFDEGTSKIIYQTKDKVGSAFWTKDSVILYLTKTETKIGRGQLHKQYTLWQIKLNKLDKKSAVNPEKIYTDPDPWYSYRYSPTGRFLMIVMDTTTTSSWVYNVLDIQNRYKFTIANIKIVTEGNRLAWAWHPKENKAMYSIGNLDKSDIYELDLVSRKNRKVYTEKGVACSLTYSGTGNRIAYYVGKMGHSIDAIVSIKTDGTDWKRVSPSVLSANFYLTDPTFAWQPNGDKLAFLLVPWTARDIWKLGVYTATFK